MSAGDGISGAFDITDRRGCRFRQHYRQHALIAYQRTVAEAAFVIQVVTAENLIRTG